MENSHNSFLWPEYFIEYFCENGFHVSLWHPSFVYISAQWQYTAVQNRRTLFWNNFPYIKSLHSSSSLTRRLLEIIKTVPASLLFSYYKVTSSCSEVITHFLVCNCVKTLRVKNKQSGKWLLVLTNLVFYKTLDVFLSISLETYQALGPMH